MKNKFSKFYFFYSCLSFLFFFPFFVVLFLFKIIIEEKFYSKEVYELKYSGNELNIINKKKIRSGFNNCLLKITCNNSFQEEDLLYKKFCLFGSFFTFWGNFFTPYGNYRKISSKKRMINEINYNNILRNNNINAPKIIDYNFTNNSLLMNYISGQNLDCLIADDKVMYKVGRLVAKIHSLKIFLNDNTPTNYILRGKDIFIVDLEGFSNKGNKYWDLAIFVYWIERLNGNIKKFINGYETFDSKSNIDRKLLKNITDMLRLYNIIFTIGYYLRKII